MLYTCMVKPRAVVGAMDTSDYYRFRGLSSAIIRLAALLSALFDFAVGKTTSYLVSLTLFWRG